MAALTLYCVLTIGAIFGILLGKYGATQSQRAEAAPAPSVGGRRKINRIQEEHSNTSRLRRQIRLNTTITVYVKPSRRVRVRQARRTRRTSSDSAFENKVLERFPKFLELPRELRDNIYNHVLSCVSSQCQLSTTQTIAEYAIYPYTLPNLSFTSKRLHQEVLRAWLRRTRFIVPHDFSVMTHLTKFLARTDGFREIRTLSFPELRNHGSELFGDSTVSNMVAKCSGLRSLRFDIKAYQLFTFRTPLPASHTPDIELKSPSEIFDRFCLQSLFELHNLRHLAITVVAERSVLDTLLPHESIRPEDFLNNLKTAINNGFRDKKTHIHVEFIGPKTRDLD
jgi:hypothetical protein